MSGPARNRCLAEWTVFAIALAFVITVSMSPAAVHATERDLTLQELEQLVASVTQSPDPASAYAALSPRRQRDFMNYVTPVRFIGATSDRTASRSTQGGKLAALMADPCNTAHNWVRGQNSFGATLWQFNHEVTWCWNGSIITNNPATRSWASNVCGACGWSYHGTTFEGRYPNDGYGQSVFTYQSEGYFELAWPYQQCYPVLRTEVYSSGGYYFQQWGC